VPLISGKNGTVINNLTPNLHRAHFRSHKSALPRQLPMHLIQAKLLPVTIFSSVYLLHNSICQSKVRPELLHFYIGPGEVFRFHETIICAAYSYWHWFGACYGVFEIKSDKVMFTTFIYNIFTPDFFIALFV
jgi:hypothetical protein